MGNQKGDGNRLNRALKMGEIYKLMTWMGSRREESLYSPSEEVAKKASSELGFDISSCSILTARRDLWPGMEHKKLSNGLSVKKMLRNHEERISKIETELGLNNATS